SIGRVRAWTYVHPPTAGSALSSGCSGRNTTSSSGSPSSAAVRRNSRWNRASPLPSAVSDVASKPSLKVCPGRLVSGGVQDAGSDVEGLVDPGEERLESRVERRRRAPAELGRSPRRVRDEDELIARACVGVLERVRTEPGQQLDQGERVLRPAADVERAPG